MSAVQLANVTLCELVIDKAVEQLGCTVLKPKQREAVVASIKGRDVFVILPNGYGKSLCYGILPLVFKEL